MKKRLLAGLTCAALLAGPSAAFAESTDVNLYVNSAYIGGSEADGQVYINDAGRTMIPLRVVGDAMDYDTEWSAGTIHITDGTGQVDVTLTVGETAYTANGEAGTFETAPTIKDGRTYLPARDFSEIYGNVYWDGATRSVWVTQGDELRYNVIGQTLYRSDENGIQAVALPDNYTIYNNGTSDPIVAARVIDGVSYLGIMCRDDWTTPVPLFRDDGDHMTYMVDIYPSSFYVDGDTVYFTDGVGAGGWQNTIRPNVLYTGVVYGQVIRHKMDFNVNECVLDMKDGVLTATDKDGVVHTIGDLEDYPASLDGIHWDS